jgi:perosamine synthetase
MRVAAAKIGFSEEDRATILERIDDCLKTGQLTLGENVRQFEEAFAQTVGVRYACAVNSGTGALEIALRTFGVRGKVVLVPTNTFFATAAAVVHAGGYPRFVDVKPGSLSIDENSLGESWSPDCAGVIVVHVGGAIVPAIENIQQFCGARGLFLLEDAAHAHGSSLNGKLAGTLGDAAAFSFYPTKVVTSGEGGMLVTEDERIYLEAQCYRDQGKLSFGDNIHILMGYNWRMSELHAVVGQVHLGRLKSSIAVRRRIAAIYDQGLFNLGLHPLVLPSGAESNYYKYPVILPAGVERRELKQELRERWGVNLSGEVYELPCHQQPIFAPYVDTGLPAAEAVCRQHICLPIYPDLTEEQAQYVLTALQSCLTKSPYGGAL